MTHSIAIAGSTDLTGLDFEAGLEGRIYENGVKVATPGGVTVTPLAADPTRGTISGLPLVAGRVYAATVRLNGSHQVAYWPTASFFPWRVIPVRTTPETIASLDVRLIEGTIESAYPLSIAEGVAGGGDWIVSGWPQTVGAWALTWSAGELESSIWWTVAAAAAATGMGHDFWGAIIRDAYADAMVAESVTFTSRTGAAVTAAGCQVIEQGVHGFSSGGALATATLRRVVIPRVNGNVEPHKSWTAKLADGTEFSIGSVVSKPGHWIVESAER